MNEMLKGLTERRSCRSYRADPIPREVLDQILAAGTYAATGMGRQSPLMIAVTDREVRDRLSKLNAAVMGADTDPFYGAPTVVAVLADRAVPTYLYDGSLVLGNLMNAAHALGVGSCWIHRAREVFAGEEGQALLRSLGITGDYEGIGFCILGWPDGPCRPAAPRKEGYVRHV